MPRKSRYEIELDDEERDALGRVARSRTESAALVLRAQVILLASEGLTDAEIGQELGITRQTAGKWRKSFYERGLGPNFPWSSPDFSSLEDRPRSGRPKHPRQPPHDLR